MGAYIEGRFEKKNKEGKWETISGGADWFDFQNYFIYGWLADVRNMAGVPPLPYKWEKAGEPINYDCDYNYTLDVKALLDFDYDTLVEDRRDTGRGTLPEGEGVTASWREHLGEWWFEQLNILKESGAERLVFNFT